MVCSVIYRSSNHRGGVQFDIDDTITGTVCSVIWVIQSQGWCAVCYGWYKQREWCAVWYVSSVTEIGVQYHMGHPSQKWCVVSYGSSDHRGGVQCDGSHRDESMPLDHHEERKRSCFSDSKGTFISVLVGSSGSKCF